ncbi:cytochrome P450 6a2-like [Sitophilus oryzae]|uniref:Cytochrome P450 6a2-like n=1 Tax=Sitophilus oryzae TaxID=7048 RepID=A0A6J2X6Q3_SITOR|nr:cytochrome P450 6a2-like [Sitophilus oryzae]
MFWFYVIFGVVVFIYSYFHYSYMYWLELRVPSLSPEFPFGDMKDPILRRQCMGEKIKEIYDFGTKHWYNYIGLYFFSRKVFLPIDPELIKNILVKDFNYFSDRGIHYDEKYDPLSAHLFSIAGPKWKNLRAKLTPAYSPVKIKGMFDIMYKCAHEMMLLVGEIAMSGRPVDIKEIMARYSTDVIGCCAFGLDCNTMRDPDAEFRKMGKRAFTQTVGDLLKMVVIRSFPFLARLFGIGVFPKDVTEFFRRVVRETIEYREKNNVTRTDFMQLLVQLKQKGKVDEDTPTEEQKSETEPGTALTIDEAAAQAFIFFLAGFETTSTTTSFALFELSINFMYREKARKEISAVLEKYNGTMTYDALMEMKYLDQIISETLRKYPPAPVFLRVCTKRYPIPDTDAYIEKGQSVLIPCYGLHRDDRYWHEPDIFDPERFSEKNKDKIVDGTYIPFGAGPRNCIGIRFALVQAKIALALFLMNFDFDLSPRTKLPLKMETKGIILSPIGGLWLRVNPID